MIRLFAVTGCLVFALVATGCNSSSAPTTPTPAPTPAPTPTPPPAPVPPPAPPPPAPAAPAALSSLTLASTGVVGQVQTTGTVTLTAPAPAGGALIRLENNRLEAKVPASVTVAAGATTATFTVDTATVDSRVDVTLTATYADTARTVVISVLLPRPKAIFTVTSETLGQDACKLIEGGLMLDCRLEGRGSEGKIVRYSWYLDASIRMRTEKADTSWNEIDVDCRFVTGASTSEDSRGRYVNMTVTLEVTDKDGDGNTSSRVVKLYTNGNCGF